MARFSKFTLNIEVYEQFVVCRVSLQTSLERNFVQSVKWGLLKSA